MYSCQGGLSGLASGLGASSGEIDGFMEQYKNYSIVQLQGIAKTLQSKVDNGFGWKKFSENEPFTFAEELAMIKSMLSARLAGQPQPVIVPAPIPISIVAAPVSQPLAPVYAAQAPVTTPTVTVVSPPISTTTQTPVSTATQVPASSTWGYTPTITAVSPPVSTTTQVPVASTSDNTWLYIGGLLLLLALSRRDKVTKVYT